MAVEKGKIEIELVRSTICTPQWMRVIVRTLGIRKMRGKVIQPDNKAIRGMIAKVPHLLKVTEAGK